MIMGPEAGFEGVVSMKLTVAYVVQLLTYQVEDMLAPKVQFLLDLGVEKDSLPAIVSRSPDILSTGVGTSLAIHVCHGGNEMQGHTAVFHFVFDMRPQGPVVICMTVINVTVINPTGNDL
jgi:hypothetical protein